MRPIFECTIPISEGHNIGVWYFWCILRWRSYFWDAYIHSALQMGWQRTEAMLWEILLNTNHPLLINSYQLGALISTIFKSHHVEVCVDVCLF